MNATLKKLEKLLNSRRFRKPKVITLDSLHTRQMTVVEGGTLAQMKRCLLNLPSMVIPLMGTYITSGWERSFNTAMAADVMIGLTGTVCSPAIYLETETEMTVVKNREVRGQPQHVVMLDEANFRLEP